MVFLKDLRSEATKASTEARPSAAGWRGQAKGDNNR